MTLQVVYYLRDDERRVAAIQETSRHRPGFGFKAEPALFGSRKWWKKLDTPKLPVVTLTGTISEVYWASMGDWPECKITSHDGETTTWTREGDISRYVAGLGIVVRYVIQQRKDDAPLTFAGMGGDAKVVIAILIEESELRSDPRAPGPGGIGLR